MDRKERIKKVFAYLRDSGYIHTQKDLAAAIGSTPPNVSKMLKGDPSVLTDRICVRIQKTFKIISAEWLISGAGEMIVATNNNNSNSAATQQPSLPDYSSLMNATIAAMDSTIASLKRELAEKEASTKTILDAKEETIASLMRELDTKDVLIRSLRQQVSDLSFALSALKEKSTSGYPFTPMGVAEDGNKKEVGTSVKIPSRHK